MMKKKTYSGLVVHTVEMTSPAGCCGILAASTANDTTIVAAGQELGETNDLSLGIDSGTDKTFSHEWNTGF